MLYLIGIGLGNEKDLTFNARDILKECGFVYLEGYTSKICFDVKKLEKLIGKKVIVVDRNFVESGDEIIQNAKNGNVAFLVKGDVFSATTHTDLFLRARQENVECRVLHNASIINAVGETGLSLYKFGKVVSVPFDSKNLDSPYETFLSNGDMHTLFLLDLRPSEDKYMNFKEALNYLLKKSSERNDNKINSDTKVVVCAAIGTNDSVIKYGKLSELLELNIEIYPQCVVVPGELHFMEEEVLNLFKF